MTQDCNISFTQSEWYASVLALESLHLMLMYVDFLGTLLLQSVITLYGKKLYLSTKATMTAASAIVVIILKDAAQTLQNQHTDTVIALASKLLCGLFLDDSNAETGGDL